MSKLLARLPLFVKGKTRVAPVGVQSQSTSSTRQTNTHPDVLFHFTSGRWLYNEDAQRAARQVTFDAEALCRIASSAVGAKTVTRMVKIAESINRVFLLKFDNDKEVIARIPTPLAGPPHYTTASEVATIDFLRRRLRLPIPAVIGWSSLADQTPVGAEFILMEKASGTAVHAFWEHLSDKEKVKFAQSLADLEKQLLDIKFSHFGSLYYTADVPERLRAPSLFQDNINGDEYRDFCIGPVARRDFWEAERETMDIDRGPWSNAIDYMDAVACREQKWISQFATPHFLDDPYRILPFQGDGNEHIELLSHYRDVIPLLVPSQLDRVAPTLWHPDLHASNLFLQVKEPTDIPKPPFTISSIIDWQGAWIGPAFLQLTVPHIVRHSGELPSGLRLPTLPDDYDILSPEAQTEAVNAERSGTIHKLFEAMAFPPPILSMKGRGALVDLEDLAGATWKYGLIPFRHAMLRVHQRWEDIAPGMTSALHFPPEGIALHERAHGTWLRHQEKLQLMDKEFGVGEYGYVAGEEPHFQQVKEAVEKKKEMFLSEAKSEDEKQVKLLLWPYRETLSSPVVTLAVEDCK